MNQNRNPGRHHRHLSDYFNVIRRYKWLIAIFVLIVVSCVTINSLRKESVYKATAQIEIEKPFLSEPSIENAMSREFKTVNEYFETQIYLLTNPDLAREVIEGMELWKDFVSLNDVDRDHTSVSSFVSDIGGDQEHPSGVSDTIAPIEKSRPEIVSNLVDWYLSNIHIAPIGNSYLVNISFTAPVPELAARVANAHAHLFVERNSLIQYQDYQQAMDWLKIQLEEQRKKVEESERAIYNYKEKHDILSFEGQEDIVSPKLVELNNLLIQANAVRIEKQAAYNQLDAFVSKKEDLFSLPEIKKNTVIQELRAQLVDLVIQKMEISSKYRSKHPKLLEIKAKIKHLELEIFNEGLLLRKSIRAELDRAVAFEETIKQSLEEHKQVAMAQNEKNINYSVLVRESESNQNIYDVLLKQAKEVSVVSHTRRNNMRVVYEAKEPQYPFGNKRKLNILLSIILGLFCGTALAFFFEYMDNSVKTPQDVVRLLGMSVLGTIPFVKALKGEKALSLPVNDDVNEERGYYNTCDFMTDLKPGFSLMQAGGHGQIIMVASTTSGEGKSTVVARSAINLARQGLRVLMVDADLQRPSLQNIFKLNGTGKKGLLDAISNVLSCNIRKGTLERCSVGDLFSLVVLKKLSGKLTITSDANTMTAFFEKGCFVHLHNDDVPFHNRLGTMLLNGGFITESQLTDSLERVRRTGQPLGYILLNAGFINQSQLQGPLKLQIEEHLQKLFSWRHGSFVFKTSSKDIFEDGKIRFDEDYTPIINRLGNMGGSRKLEKEILSHVKSLNEPNLSLLPVGSECKNSGNLLYYTLLSKFLTILKQHFHVVLVDGPPIRDAMNSVKPLFPLVDGVIFVIKSGQESDNNINEAVNYIRESQTRIIGAVLNQVKKEKGVYY